MAVALKTAWRLNHSRSSFCDIWLPPSERLAEDVRGIQDASVGLSISKTYLNAVDIGGWCGVVNGVSIARNNFNSNPSGSNYDVYLTCSAVPEPTGLTLPESGGRAR